MTKNGRYAQNRKAQRSKWLFWCLLVFVIFAVVVFCLTVMPEDGDEQPKEYAELAETEMNGEAGEYFAATESTDRAFEAEMPAAAVMDAPAEMRSATETEASIEAAKPDQIEAIYATVLEQYRQAIQMDSREFLEWHTNSTERDLQLQSIVESTKTVAEKTEELMKWLELPTLESRYPHINQTALQYIHMYREEGELYGKYHDLSYTYYDVDTNGVAELLIGDCTESRDNIIGLYTIRYQEPYTLVNSTGNRSYLTVYTDGTICVDSSGGASLHTWNFYCLNKEWNLLDAVSHYVINYKYPQSEMVGKQLDEYMEKLTPVTKFDWQPLFPAE